MGEVGGRKGKPRPWRREGIAKNNSLRSRVRKQFSLLSVPSQASSSPFLLWL
jgi:hypothetical protein